jgi:hypothetical protein
MFNIGKFNTQKFNSNPIVDLSILIRGSVSFTKNKSNITFSKNKSNISYT